MIPPEVTLSFVTNGDRACEVHHLIIQVAGQSPDIMCVDLDDIVFPNRCFHSGVLSPLDVIALPAFFTTR